MGLTVDEFYNYITQHMTPEEALKKLLKGPCLSYEKLKFDKGEEVHPELIIAMAAMDLGWNFMIESNGPIVRGLIVGTPEYMNLWMGKKPEINSSDN